MIEDTYAIPPGPHPTITPTQVLGMGGDAVYTGDRPLLWAIENLGPGMHVVEPGRYKLGKITKTLGGVYAARERGTVVIDGFKDGDTISMPDGGGIHPVVFKGWKIEGSSRAAWITEDSKGPYRVSWEWCEVDGGYDHGSASGFDSKWGFVPHRWQGYAAYCHFHDIKREHGIYAHTFMPSEAVPDMLLLGCKFARCGRTGFQHVGRLAEGGKSEAVAKVTDCVFDDCGLKDGGSALTVQGIKAVVVKGLRSYIGRDPEFVAAYKASHPGKVFGTGHFVNWNESQGGVPRDEPSELVALHDTLVWSAPGCGQASAIQVKNAKRLQVSGGLYVGTGYNKHGFEFGEGMAVDFSDIDPSRLYIGAST